MLLSPRMARVWRGAKRHFATGNSQIIASASSVPGRVVLAFGDGREASFHSVWLRDHDPATLHPTSMQRELDAAELDVEQLAGGVCKTELQDAGAKLALRWPDGGISSFDAAWLRRHCYEAWARCERRAGAAAKRVPWKAHDFKLPRVQSSDLLDKSAVGELARGLHSMGAVVVEGMPSTIDGTEEVVRSFGYPRETFYGAMWDTAPKADGDVNDTAFTNDALHPHTDCTYLVDTPGLQCFNCVAQSPSGSTKLVDGLWIAEELRRSNPTAFDFFCQTPLRFRALEGGVHVEAVAPVFRMIGGEAVEPGRPLPLAQFRYNGYDLSPLDYLSSEQIEDFYHHNATLNRLIRSEVAVATFRLEVGEMLVIDNHRVLHGRTAFEGFRNLVGCYVGRDDWESNLRIALAEEGGAL